MIFFSNSILFFASLDLDFFVHLLISVVCNRVQAFEKTSPNEIHSNSSLHNYTLSLPLSLSHVPPRPPPPSENKCQVFRLALRSSSRLDQSNVFVQKQTQPFGPRNFWLHIQRGGIFVPQNLCLQIIRAFFEWFLSLKWAILFVVNYLGLLLFFKKNGE